MTEVELGWAAAAESRRGEKRKNGFGGMEMLLILVVLILIFQEAYEGWTETGGWH